LLGLSSIPEDLKEAFEYAINHLYNEERVFLG